MTIENTTNKLREKFLKYFENNGHQRVASSSLVPVGDPTLLFTNAGMNQFKDVFLGTESRPYDRATTCQRCVRAGGKHNDLENVGYTKRHHTFFEMLGNFSFGDYFKRDAIKYAWEFLTKELNISAEKLWITVHEKDREAEKIWLEEMQVSKERFSHCGDKDNFWAMGDTGPCGYCSEIFYDYGADIPGDPPGGKNEGERYVEIWNLVFMQFERDAEGKLTELPNPSIDTGMGLERLAAVMQTATEAEHALRGNNYQIDIFKQFYADLNKLLVQKGLIHPHGIVAPARNVHEVKTVSAVVADHARAAIALIADGVTPSNEGRGYVLRSIMRRAIYHIQKLYFYQKESGSYEQGSLQPVFFEAVQIESLVAAMQQSFPELNLKQEILKIQKVVRSEEQQFLTTLQRGSKILEEEISKLTGKIIPGKIVFMLHDTYGFPAALTAEIAGQHGLTIDQAGFEAAMEKQRQMSRAASNFTVNKSLKIEVTDATHFVGYDENKTQGKIVGIYSIEGAPKKNLSVGESGIIVLDKTVFYAEAGGQVGDTGKLFAADCEFIVKDTQKINNTILHYGIVNDGEFINQNLVMAEIDVERRNKIKANHSSAHLLHKALQLVLGNHVEQKGSLVNVEHLRFDFSHFAAMTVPEIKQVEAIVNQQIRANLIVNTKVMGLDEAKQSGAVALFSEKYTERVRVVSMGSFSRELCGGTHVNAAGEIAIFKILTESGISAGTRRIEAITGAQAFSHFEKTENYLKVAAGILKTEPHKLTQRVEEIVDYSRNLEKELTFLKNKMALSNVENLIAKAINIDGIKVLIAKMEDIDVKTIRTVVEQLKQKLGSSIVLIAAVIDDKIQIAAGVSQDCVNRIQAGKLVQYFAEQLGGKGGGRADMAQGSAPRTLAEELNRWEQQGSLGRKVKTLADVLEQTHKWVKSNLT
jgi:alanyl-tRNA synthetase